MTRKRGNGRGSITERGDRRFMVRVTEADGTRRTLYARTRKDAEAKLQEALQRLEDAEPVIESRESFKAVSEACMSSAMTRHGLSRTTVGTYRSALRGNVHPVIGAKKVRDIRPADVVRVLETMQAKGLSSAYQTVTLKALTKVLSEAQEDGLIRANPARKVRPPKVSHAAKVVPDRDQVARMIDATAEPRARILMVLLAHTGTRISEALSLRWEDWDGDGTLRVMKAKGGRPRAVPVTKVLAAELRAWRKVQTEERLASIYWEETGLIVSTSIGTRWDASNARRKAFRPVADKVCPGATPHSMRHATATILLEEGVPMKVVSELLGHTDVRVTAAIYSHVTARLVQQAGDALERAIGDTNA